MSVGASLLVPRLSRGSRLSIGSLRLLLVAAIRTADVAVIVAAGLTAALLRFDWNDIPGVVLTGIVIGAPLAANILPFCGVYRLENLLAPQRALPRLLAGWLATVGGVVGCLYAGHLAHETSRLWIGYWLATGAAGLLLCRLVLWLRMLGGGLGAIRYRLAIVGPSRLAASCILRLARQDRHAQVAMIAELPRCALPGDDELDALEQRLAAQEVDEVLLATESLAPETLALIERLRHLPLEVAWAPQLPAGIGTPAGGPQVLVPLAARPVDGWPYIAKTVLDRAAAAAGLVLLAPLLLLIAVAIKASSPGPVLYRQKRAGFNHEIITILKFRTMHADQCDGMDATEALQATRGDARITPVGRLLRRASLDELPQLVNVVRGEMSLVGPRPHALPHEALYGEMIKKYYSRRRVLPGITGWAQINGLRGETDTVDKMQARVDHDIYYIENWSLSFDVRILLKTFVCGFVHPEAR